MDAQDSNRDTTDGQYRELLELSPEFRQAYDRAMRPVPPPKELYVPASAYRLMKGIEYTFKAGCLAGGIALFGVGLAAGASHGNRWETATVLEEKVAAGADIVVPPLVGLMVGTAFAGIAFCGSKIKKLE